MSKQQNKKIFELKSVKDVRYRSIFKSIQNFKMDGSIPRSGYDLRVYQDNTDNNFYYPYVFSKTLQVNPSTGLPLKSDVDKLLKAIETGEITDVEVVPRSSNATRKIENLLAGANYTLIGADSSSLLSKKSKLIVDNEQTVFEMAEVYSLSLLRDINFLDIENGSNLTANNHINYLNGFNNKSVAPVDGTGNITAKTLHRGSQVGCTIGPYISQYLYKSFNYGNIPINQQYDSEPDQDNTTDLTEWKLIQEGSFTPSTLSNTPNQYVNNGRVLGSIVHNDPLFYFYFNAALISFQNGIGPEFKGSVNNSSWISGGGPSVLESIASVSVEALQSAWFNKYQVNMTIRPEVMAQRIHTIYSSGPTSDLVTRCPGYSTLSNFITGQLSLLLNEVRSANTSGTNLLKLQYPEGSPTHPSQPAGHALVAGACCTILKAMLDTVDTSGSSPIAKLWPVSVEHSTDGTTLVPYPNDTTNITINGELNKLASNVSIGRNWAGVHYRTDADLELGEQVAISHLENKCLTFTESYNGRFNGFTLQKFDGSFIRITKDGIENL